MSGDAPIASRRGFLAGAGGLAAIGRSGAMPAAAASAVVPFAGPHQAGIVTPQQAHSYFLAFDLVTARRAAVADLLQRWTEAAGRLTQGQTAQALVQDDTRPRADSGEALGLPPARLTLTFGLGAGLFGKNGSDRYGLAARRPAALIDLPRDNGDQLDPARTGGDLSVQACADDPQVAFHAARQLALLADSVATVRWGQTGFLSRPAGNATPRNLMGFKDGTNHPADIARTVWVGEEGPAWMQGGSYLVVRRIRVALEHWDRTPVAFQEQTMGRHKLSGAPLGKTAEFADLGLDRTDADGNPVIPDTAHVRLANKASSGAEILRRGYSYNDGVNFTAERWPPWRQGMEYDAGLFFACYQRDPREGFVKIFAPMAKLDMLNQFATHTGGGLFAVPPGARPGGFVGEGLFA